MPKYRFDEIAINSTEKKKPVETDKDTYIGLEHLDSGCLEVTRWGAEVAPVGDKLVMHKGDVLFGRRRAYQKKVSIAPFDGIFSAHGMVLRPIESVITKEFFPFFISSDYFLDAAIKISVGSLSPTINWRDLAKLEFQIPPLDEQASLSSVLWAMNRLKMAYIHANYTFIKEWFSLKSQDAKAVFNRAMDEILEVVVICVDKVSEAFQLFDSQNARGKALDPHDLLKAYHLREMKNYPYEMEHAVTKWEAKDTTEIRDLFDLYLFPIWNWARRLKSKSFTAKEIDTYKGINEASIYTYARRASKAMPFFQITEPFIAGNDFFEMVDHYLHLLHDMKAEIRTNPSFAALQAILDRKEGSAGFGYTKNLFFCALLCYYDKFHNFDELAVKKLFTWAFMLRVDMENLGYDSINKYAIGDTDNSQYTNAIPIFSKISNARLHREISGVQIKVIRAGDAARTPKWNELYRQLKEINGLAEVTHA